MGERLLLLHDHRLLVFGLLGVHAQLFEQLHDVLLHAELFQQPHHILLHAELQLRLKLRQLLGFVQRLWQQHPNRRDDFPQLFFVRRRIPFRDHNHHRKQLIYHALRLVNPDAEVRPLERCRQDRPASPLASFLDGHFRCATFEVFMDKPTAVIDMSLFREICGLPAKETRDSIWDSLTSKYQIVVPLMLVEEVLVNILKPGTIPPQDVQMMASDVLQLQPCWIDDVSEYAFRELVQRQPLGKLLQPPAELQQKLLASKIDDPELIGWVERRKAERKATATQWRTEQKKLAPATGFSVVTSEQEFFERAVKREFLKALESAQEKHGMLEAILGKTFRSRHPDSVREIGEAFVSYSKDNFASFPFTLNCLTVRLAYVLAPIVRIQTPRDAEPRIILCPKRQDQDNNWADEQYVISALVCERLLTMDKGMRNIANIFRANGLWRGEVVFIDASKPLSGQIPGLLT